MHGLVSNTPISYVWKKIDLHEHMSVTLVYTWHKRPRNGYPCDPMKELWVNRDKKSVDERHREDHSLTVPEVVDMLEIGISSDQRILSNLLITFYGLHLLRNVFYVWMKWQLFFWIFLCYQQYTESVYIYVILREKCYPQTKCIKIILMFRKW